MLTTSANSLPGYQVVVSREPTATADQAVIGPRISQIRGRPVAASAASQSEAVTHLIAEAALRGANALLSVQVKCISAFAVGRDIPRPRECSLS